MVFCAIVSGIYLQLDLFYVLDLVMLESEDSEIIAGVGNEVFYFFGRQPKEPLTPFPLSSAGPPLSPGRGGLVLHSSGENYLH